MTLTDIYTNTVLFYSDTGSH